MSDSPPEVGSPAPSPKFVVREPILVAVKSDAVGISALPPKKAEPVKKLKGWLDSIDTDKDGVPFYRDPDELRGIARIAWKVILLAAKLLPNHTKIGEGADRVVDVVDRAGLREEADKL